MKKTWPVFLAGVLTGVLALGALLTLTEIRTAEAQLPELPHEQIQLMRDMSSSLKGIEQAVRDRCP